MATYISLLRGINVSGQKKVNMKELKALYESLNFSNVSTYIQSGNVVFNSDEYTEDELKHVIELAIKQHYGFNVPVIIVNSIKLNTALNNLPFKNMELATQGSKILFSFLSATPKKDLIDALPHYLSASEKLFILDDVVYLFCPDGYGKTKLTNNLLEKKLGVTSTTRNLKTIVKLQEILKDISIT